MHKLQLKPFFACFTFLWCMERLATVGWLKQKCVYVASEDGQRPETAYWKEGVGGAL